MGKSRGPTILINLITGSRLLLALGVALLTPWLADRTWAIVAGTGLVALIEATDLIDGWLARRHDAVSQFGKVFDPYTDSLSRITVYWSLAVVGRALSFVPLLMALRDITVGYTRLVMSHKGKDVAARWWGKGKAVTQGVCALALMSGPFYWGEAGEFIKYTLSFAVVFVTVVSAGLYGIEALRPAQGREAAG